VKSATETTIHENAHRTFPGGKLIQLFGLCLLLGVCTQQGLAQDATNIPATVVTNFPGGEVNQPEPPSVEIPNATAPVPARGHDDDDTVAFGANVEYRRPLNGDYDYVTEVTLFGELDFDQYNSAGLLIGGGVVQLKSGSYADTVARQPFIGEVGVFGRHYFAPSHAFLRPYVTAGVNWFLMGWDYRFPVAADDGTVVRDWLYGVDGYVGVGLYAGLRKNLRIFGEIEVGGTAMPEKTEAGVQNNMFDGYGYVGVKAGLSWGF
jgi:hypothetical protein